MAKDDLITRESFENLLAWLDLNRDAAARKYEKIRRRLIRIFTGRGCFEAEMLVDEAFDRVTRKMPQLAENYTGDPSLYFYGVANKIHLEWLKKQQRIDHISQREAVSFDHHHAVEHEYGCLERCLQKLPAADRRLIVEYYKEDKSAKIESRRRLAETFGINAGALQVRAFRLRLQLKDCIKNCVGKTDGKL